MVLMKEHSPYWVCLCEVVVYRDDMAFETVIGMDYKIRQP